MRTDKPVYWVAPAQKLSAADLAKLRRTSTTPNAPIQHPSQPTSKGMSAMEAQKPTTFAEVDANEDDKIMSTSQPGHEQHNVLRPQTAFKCPMNCSTGMVQKSRNFAQQRRLQGKSVFRKQSVCCAQIELCMIPTSWQFESSRYIFFAFALLSLLSTNRISQLQALRLQYLIPLTIPAPSMDKRTTMSQRNARGCHFHNKCDRVVNSPFLLSQKRTWRISFDMRKQHYYPRNLHMLTLIDLLNESKLTKKVRIVGIHHRHVHERRNRRHFTRQRIQRITTLIFPVCKSLKILRMSCAHHLDISWSTCRTSAIMWPTF